MVDRNWDPILGVRSDEGASAAPPRSSHERRRILAQVRPHTHTQRYMYILPFINLLFIYYWFNARQVTTHTQKSRPTSSSRSRLQIMITINDPVSGRVRNETERQK